MVDITLPHDLRNNTTADADAVMANFAALLDFANKATKHLDIIGTHTGAVTIDGAVLSSVTQGNITPRSVANWCFTGSDGNLQVSYDAIQGLGILTPGSTLDLVNGVVGYFISQTPLGASFPTGCALLGFGIADADGAAAWGLNTVLTDKGPSGGAGTGRFLANEFDLNIHYAGTTATALQIGGTSLVQPAEANGIGLLTLDSNNGLTAKWSTFLVTSEGATNTFLVAGAKASSGANVAGQDFTMHYRNAGNISKSISYAAQPNGGVLFANSESKPVILSGIPFVLPTSSAGLTTGSWWNNGGTLT